MPTFLGVREKNKLEIRGLWHRENCPLEASSSARLYKLTSPVETPALFPDGHPDLVPSLLL